MNENDIDIDGQDDLDQVPIEKPSLKEAWQSNPMLKIAAAILIAAVLIGGYMTLTKPDPVEEVKAVIAPRTQQENVKLAPGEGGEQDEVYKKAIAEKNEQNVKTATATGGSVIALTNTVGKASSIEVPQANGGGEIDPLKEWKDTVQSKTLKPSLDAIVEEETPAPQAEVVPMVTPIRPQASTKADPKAAQTLSGQMKTILSAQAPAPSKTLGITKTESAYLQMKADAAKKETGDGGTKIIKGGKVVGTINKDGTTTAEGKVIIPVASIIYAQLLTELNSDVPSPALALILSGPFTGGRIFGKMTTEDEYIVIKFDGIVKDTVAYEIDGLALDENTTLPALQTSIDHHYLTRILLPAAATFVSSYGKALGESGSKVTVTTGGAVVEEKPKPTPKESAYEALGEAADDAGEVIKKDAKDGPTIKVARGTTFGVLLLESIKTTDVRQ